MMRFRPDTTFVRAFPRPAAAAGQTVMSTFAIDSGRGRVYAIGGFIHTVTKTDAQLCKLTIYVNGTPVAWNDNGLNYFFVAPGRPFMFPSEVAPGSTITFEMENTSAASIVFSPFCCFYG